jgi:hypothetical protein
MAEESSTFVVHPYNWSYAENPDIPELVYHFATAYMVIIGTFGAISNLAILLAFFAAPAKVSLAFSLPCYLSFCLFAAPAKVSFGLFLTLLSIFLLICGTHQSTN